MKTGVLSFMFIGNSELNEAKQKPAANNLAPRPGRLFVCTEFFRLPNELRRGAHLCLTPSCSEPFGVSNRI